MPEIDKKLLENHNAFSQEEAMEEGSEVGEDEIIKNLTGYMPDGSSKSAIGAVLISFDENGNEKPETEYIPDDTCLEDIYFVGDFCILSLNFKAFRNVWLKRTVDLVDEFHHSEEEYTLAFTFTDMTGRFPYVFTASNPLICMQGIDTKTGQMTLVRMAFYIESIIIGELDYTMEELRADYEREQNAMNYEAYKAEELEAENARIINEMEENTGFMGDQFGMDKVLRPKEYNPLEDKNIRIADD